MASNGGAIPKRPKSVAKSEEGATKRGKSKSGSKKAKAEMAQVEKKESRSNGQQSGGASSSTATSPSPPTVSQAMPASPIDLTQCRKCKKPPVTPVLLPCLHPVCLNCVEIPLTQSACFECKLVNKHRTPLFPDFQMRRKEMGSQGLNLRRHACTVCQKNTKCAQPTEDAHSRCVTCSHYLCKECDAKHHQKYRG